MTTTLYPSSFLAFPFLSVSNGTFRFGVSSDSATDVSVADLGLASVPSILLFDDNSNVSVSFSSIDPSLFATGTPTSDDYVLYYDNTTENTQKATIADLLSAAAGAPIDATYVTLTSNATLTNESVLAAGSGISLAGSTISADFSAVQAKDATLTSIANLGTTADKTIYTTGSDTWAETSFTSFGRSLVDDADAATARGTLGLGTMATQASSSFLSVANDLSDLASASTARTNLGLGTLATQSGTFSGTSSGTNTGDQNLFSTISVSGQSDVVADTTTDTLTLVAGSNVTITTNATTDTITISATGGGGGGLSDADYGDITVSGSGTVMTIDAGVVTTSKLGGDITTAGKALLDDADASAQRTTLGLGSLATQSGTFSGTSSGTNTGDQNVFTTIAVSGQSNVVADTTTDTLTLVAGTNVTITTNATTDEITISATGGSGSFDYGLSGLIGSRFFLN